jgi:hypothetical protein
LRLKKNQLRNQPIIIIQKKLSTPKTSFTNGISPLEESNEKSQEEENKRRKNKEQIKVLQNEYKKNTEWTRP